MNGLKDKPRGLWSDAASVVLCFAAAVGCNGPSATPVLPVVVESPQRDRGTLLFSDLRDAEHAEPVLNESFKIRNPTEDALDVELVAVNCSCATVVHEGNPWTTGSILRLASGETSSIGLRRDVSSLPGTHSAERVLGVVPPGDDGTRSTITLSASVNVYADVTASPQSILVSFDGPSSPPVVKKLSVQHVHREGRSAGEPRITGLPVAARVERLWRSAPTEVVAGSLRRDTWSVELSFSDSERDTPPLLSGIATVNFAAPDGNRGEGEFLVVHLSSLRHRGTDSRGFRQCPSWRAESASNRAQFAGRHCFQNR